VVRQDVVYSEASIFLLSPLGKINIMKSKDGHSLHVLESAVEVFFADFEEV